MNIRNTSRLPDYEVEILLAFALRYVEEVAKRPLRLGQVDVTHTRHAYRGRAWYAGRTLLRIGSPKHYPVTARYARYKDFFEYEVRDYREGLVMLAAHEFWHHARWQVPEAKATPLEPGRRVKSMEHDCETVASDAIDAFRKVRADIDARIARHGERQAAKASAAVEREQSTRALKSSPEYRLAQAEKQKGRWERKAKLAATKLKKLNRRIAALQRTIREKLI